MTDRRTAPPADNGLRIMGYNKNQFLIFNNSKSQIKILSLVYIKI